MSDEFIIFACMLIAVVCFLVSLVMAESKPVKLPDNCILYEEKIYCLKEEN